jgi:phosphoribosylformimino-5-aminoimidazole carboxamide ribotide isomerase
MSDLPQKSPAFELIPAVDVLGESAVRLRQGDFDQLTHEAGDPRALIRRFARSSPAYLHLVDLQAAKDGAVRPQLMTELVACAEDIPVEVAGGVRSVRDAVRLVEAGASRVVVGTAALSGGSLLSELVAALGEQLVVAVDVRDGRAAVDGWQTATHYTVEDVLGLLMEAGVQRVMCTAIERDGMLDGPDLNLVAHVRDQFGPAVLAAGGVRTDEHVERLRELGIEGAIVGRALLDGTITLPVRAGAAP